jgi:CheY-like chemotaxis protein
MLRADPFIVAVTANAMAGYAEHSRAVVMDDHISKPITVRELLRVLAPWLEPRWSSAAESPDSIHAA